MLLALMKKVPFYEHKVRVDAPVIAKNGEVFVSRHVEAVVLIDKKW